MTWAESVRTQLSEEGVPFGVRLTVSESQSGGAVVRLYTESPLHETTFDLKPGHPNVERAYDDAVRQHQRVVRNLKGGGA